MMLAELLASLGDLAPAAGAPLDATQAARAVKAVVYDSRKAGAGSLFVALRGEKADGAAFAVQAVSRGAPAGGGHFVKRPKTGMESGMWPP